MAFRDHLRADQNIDLALAESAEDAFKVAHVPHCVAIHTADARVRIKGFQLRLESLRALANIMDVFAVTFFAAGGRMAGKTTVVAEQLVDRAMVRQRDT